MSVSAVSPSRPYPRPARLAVVVSGWPRISEVFALNELRALQRAGMLEAVFATKPGDADIRHSATDWLAPLVEVLPDGDVSLQASVVSERLAGCGVAAVHGYFAHQPTDVAARSARRLGVPFGFSVHALDGRKVPRAELARRAAGAAVVIACNKETSAYLAAAGTKPCLVRHGVDLAAFPATKPPNESTVSLLAVGRFVEKKGFDVLLDALARLQRPWRLRLVGDGPLREHLERLIYHRGLAASVELVGRRTHDTLPALYAGADIVVVPSVVDRNGDRDGLPNVVPEAMASARPVIASDVAAIPCAVRDGVTGTLVPSRDAPALARALTELIDDPARRMALGAAGRTVVKTDFDLDQCGANFCRTLERAYG